MKPSQRVVSSEGDDWKTTWGMICAVVHGKLEGRWRRTPLPLICMAHPSEDGSMPKAFGKAMRRSRNEWAEEIAAYYWVVVSNIFYFHPYLGKIPILTNIFQRG